MKGLYRLGKAAFAFIFLVTASMFLVGCAGDGSLIDRLQSPFGNGLFGLLILFLAISAIIELVNSKRGSADKILWIAIVVFFPIGGFIIYRLFGNRRRF